MLPMSFSGSSSAVNDSISSNATGATSGTTDAGSTSKAAKIFNITMGHGNTPANTANLAQGDGSGMDWKTIAAYAGAALVAFLIVFKFMRK